MARNDENPPARQSKRMGTDHSKDKPFKELKNVIIQQKRDEKKWKRQNEKEYEKEGMTPSPG